MAISRRRVRTTTDGTDVAPTLSGAPIAPSVSGWYARSPQIWHQPVANAVFSCYGECMEMTFPTFSNPPLDEVVIGVQFAPLPGFRAAHTGIYWNRIRERYPATEDQPPLAAVIEPDGPSPAAPAAPKFTIRQAVLIPRSWFLDQTGNRIIQVQPGRFLRNWRKLEDSDVYPRFAVLIQEFRDEWDRFASFVKDESLGDLSINQCELTYIDHIEPTGEGKLGDVSDVFAVARTRPGTAFLPVPEITNWATQYKLPDGRGRLYVEVNPVLRARDMATALGMNLTVRGAPAGPSTDDLFSWFNLAHEWINRAFSELTKPEMHQRWGINQ